MIGVERVATLSALLLDPDEPCGLEPLKMPGGGGPRVAESLGDLARGHGPASGVERHEDVASVLVGQRPEHRLEFVELAQAQGPPRQSVSLVSKWGNAIPGPIALSSTNVAIFSHSTPILGC